MSGTAFDRFIEPLDYPMFVLTVPGSSRSGPSGCLIGFTTQCSISPARYLACVSRTNHTFQLARRAPVAALHLLTAADHDLASLFGEETGDEVDKFARCEWSEGPHGVPLLTRCPTWMVGTIYRRVDLGDHQGLVLSPIKVGRATSARPLLSSALADLHAGHPA